MSSTIGEGGSTRRHLGEIAATTAATEEGLTKPPTPQDTDGAVAPREWDARSYHAVSEPQFAWGKRVMSSLELAGNETVVDVGCGTGRLTALLADRLPDGSIVALDRSVNMAQVAAKTLADHRQTTVAVADLSAMPFGSTFDVVFSTATFHWVLDHDRLFAELYKVLKPGGRLHAQCGGGTNLQRIQTRAFELAQTPEFAPMFASWRPATYYADVDSTERRLRASGFVDIDVNLEAAPFEFANADAYATFVSTVVLRTFLSRIDDAELRRKFVDTITELALSDTPALELDYWRLNIRARRS
jgi:trans-aconitate 2-methyltransferase